MSSAKFMISWSSFTDFYEYVEDLNYQHRQLWELRMLNCKKNLT